MRSLKISTSIVQKIDSLIARFWWANNVERGIHWVSKDYLHIPKGLRGLSTDLALCIHHNSHILISKVLNIDKVVWCVKLQLG